MRRRPRSHLALGLTVLALAGACAGGGEDASGRDDATAPGGDTSSSAVEEGAPESTSTSSSRLEEAGSELVLRGDGLGVVDLGADPDAAVAAVSDRLGEPTSDTGWESSFGSYGTCPGERVRAVAWESLVLLFTDGETEQGSGEHLFAWRLSGAPPAVATSTGFGYLATAEDAEQLHPGAVELVPADEPFPAFLEVAVDGGTIVAFLDELDQVTNLEAGSPCGE